MKISKSKAKQLEQAWERLGVQPEDVAKHPTITPILLKSLGNINSVIITLRGHEAKEAIEFIRIWDLASRNEQKLLPFEAFCLAAKVTPRKMMGMIMEAVVEQSSMAATMLAASAHPEIVQKTIKIAKTVKGSEERKIIHQNRGFMPMPKNQTINNFGQITQDNRKQIANVAVSQLDKDSDEISSVVEKFNSVRQLPTGKTEIIDILAEESDEV